MGERSSPKSRSVPRRWLVLSVDAPPRGEEHLLVDALRRLGARAVERQRERFLAHLPPTADLEALLRDAKVAIRASTSIRDPLITWQWQEHEEWSSDRSRRLKPRRVTDRIVITSASHDGEIREADLVVRLHSGMAFGTAEHPTTRGCLRILEVLLQPGSRIADVGTGSGILAIAAALLGATTVIALEMDPLACAFAEQNVALNEVADRVQVRQGKVSSESLGALRPFDGILANLELAIVQPLLPALREALAPRGWLVVSGILRQEHATLLRSARSAGFELKGEERENGWWTGWFRAGEMGGPEDRKGQALPAEVLRQRGV